MKDKNRGLYLLTLFSALSLAGFGVYHEFSRPERFVNGGTFQKIERGMSDSEIYGLLGSPHKKVFITYDPRGLFVEELWFSNELNIGVTFDETRTVVKKYGWFEMDANPSFIRLLMKKILD